MKRLCKMDKAKRLRKIELSILKDIFKNIRPDEKTNESVKSMLVGIQTKQYNGCRILSPEHTLLLDSLLTKANSLRLLYLNDLYKRFSDNPESVSALFGKYNEKFGKWKFNANNANGKAFKESFVPKITDAQINTLEPKTNSAFTESVMMSIGKDIAGFLDKYYSIKNDMNHTYSENKDTYSENKYLLNNITFPSLPDTFATKTEVNNYNLAVAQINMVIEKIKQVSNTPVKYLKRLKGFPSFPVVERQENNTTPEQAGEQINHLLLTYEQSAKRYWESLTADELSTVLNKNYSTTPVQKDIAEWFTDTFRYHNGYMSKTYDVVLIKIRKKLKKIAAHMEQKPDDKAAKQKYWNLKTGESMVLLEGLRYNNFDEFIKVRAEVDFLISSAKGFWVKKDKDEKGLEITGFSGSKHSMLALFGEKPHQQWALVFNHFKDDKAIEKQEITVNGYISDKLSEQKIDLNKHIIIPLAFGRHYGRQYLYDNTWNLDNGKMHLNNARIIKRDGTYWVALTFTKKELQSHNSFDDKYKHIIGIDRGENIPVVATVMDLRGHKVETIELGIEHKSKMTAIASAKAEQQRNTGGYSDKLAHRAKNISDKTIERIAIDLLYLATKYRGLLVMEDLSRGFGRQGKKTIVSNNQYTRIEDLLANKLKTNGLSKKGTTVLNCRDGLVGKVLATHTSMTCSACGYVHRKENIDIDSLHKQYNIWHITMSGKDFPLDIEYRGWKGRTENANDKINELVKDKNISELTDTNKDKIQKIIQSALSPRKSQECFVCPMCGFQDNADANASLNIGRRWIFEKEDEVNAMYDGSFEKTKTYKTRSKKTNSKVSYHQQWADYYKEKADEWKKKN